MEIRSYLQRKGIEARISVGPEEAPRAETPRDDRPADDSDRDAASPDGSEEMQAA